MKRSVSFLLFLFLAFTLNAQQPAPQIHPLLRSVVDNPGGGIPPILRGPAGARQGARRINGQEALDLQLRTTASRAQLEALGIKVRTLHDGRATATVPVSALAALAARPDVQSITLPVPVRPNLDKSVPETGVSSLRSQSAGIFSGTIGAGAIVGVVDSGIDVTHPDFLDAAGNTRILYLWDQTGAGPSPAPYGYGTEWTSADIDGGLCTELDDPAAFGHGSHVTGIAAGNGAAPDGAGATYNHIGMAPAADIIFVKTDWSSTGIIDAMSYIFDQATALGLPAVVNLSLGTQLGAHDGTNPMEQEIDTLVATAGRAVVVAAGNEGGDSIHAEIDAQPALSVVGPYFDVPTYTKASGAGNDYIYAVGYYPSTDNLTVHLWSPSGIHYVRNLNTSFLSDGCTSSLAGADGAVILCNNYRSNLGEGTADREILLLVYDDTATKPPAVGSWHFALTGNTVAGSGEVDFWMQSSLGTSGVISSFTTNVDTEETLGIPATSNDAIAVGAYLTKVCWDDSTGASWSYTAAPSLGDIADFSSLGPTRDGRSKPEVAAPGMGIVSSLASNVGAYLIANGYGAYVVDSNHLLLQGTSQAAPHVTGAVALLLAANPALTASGVESLLRSNAREDSFTAAYDQPGLIIGGTKNYVFGSGKLDLGTWAYLDPYETNNTLRTAHAVLSGEVLGGYVDYAADIDLFELGAFSIGDTVNITLGSLPDNYKLGLLKPFSLGGSCGTSTFTSVSTSDNAGTTDESIAFTATAFSLPKYLRVASSAGGFSAVTPYSLKAVITRPETAAVHNTLATAQALPAYNEFKISGGTSAAADRDYYSLTAVNGQTITARPGSLLRTVQILDSTGAVLATGTGATATYNAPAFPLGVSHTYYIVVKGTAAAAAYTMTTTLN